LILIRPFLLDLTNISQRLTYNSTDLPSSIHSA
jgi:hypothetical protein